MGNRANFGRYQRNTVSGETVDAFIPEPFPPAPPLELSKLYPLIEEASLALGRLDGISINVPDTALFLYMYVRKEAVLSSQIEGTQSSLSDLLMFENNEKVNVPIDDVTEVSNYVAAMEHGLKRIRGGFPLCMRLLREMHEILLSRGRGENKQPGEFRRSQNWVGGPRPALATYVPPPWEHVEELLSKLEKFLHDDSDHLPTLIKAGLAHLQFESIHPFLDGNGRLGRLLITFILCVDGILQEPMLYLSLYFKMKKSDYYEFLQHVRKTGDWESWLAFFLTGVIITAKQAVATIQKIHALFAADLKKISALGKMSASVSVVFHFLKSHPITDSKRTVDATGLTMPTVNLALQKLSELGVVEEITGQSRNKVYKYTQYIATMDEELA